MHLHAAFGQHRTKAPPNAGVVRRQNFRALRDEVKAQRIGIAAPRVQLAKFVQFDDVYRRLEMWPASGPARRRLGAQARIAVVPPFVMIYDWDQTTDTVRIVRVVRGGRKITRKLVRG